MKRANSSVLSQMLTIVRFKFFTSCIGLSRKCKSLALGVFSNSRALSYKNNVLTLGENIVYIQLAFLILGASTSSYVGAVWDRSCHTHYDQSSPIVREFIFSTDQKRWDAYQRDAGIHQNANITNNTSDLSSSLCDLPAICGSFDDIEPPSYTCRGSVCALGATLIDNDYSDDYGNDYRVGSYNCKYISTGNGVCPEHTSDTGLCVDNPTEPAVVVVSKNEGNTGCEKGPSLEPSDRSLGPSNKVADPVNVTTGSLYTREIDYIDSRGYLSVVRYYDSASGGDLEMGLGWRHSGQHQIFLTDYNKVLLLRAGKAIHEYIDNGAGKWKADSDPRGYVERHTSGFRHVAADGHAEEYGLDGKLLEYNSKDSVGLTVSSIPSFDIGSNVGMNDGVRTVTDPFGNSLEYRFIDDRVSKIILPDGKEILYTYLTNTNIFEANVSLLETVTKPYGDGGTVTRTYHYDDINAPNKLSDITNEYNVLSNQWEYDTSERVIVSKNADGADTDTGMDNVYYLDYSVAGQTTLTNPLGKDTIYHYSSYFGVNKIDQIEGEASASCAAANKDYTYNASNGLLKTSTDWEGNVTKYVYDAKGLVRKVYEGYQSDSNYQRYSTQSWKPIFNLPDQREVFDSTGAKVRFENNDYDNDDGKLHTSSIEDFTGNSGSTSTHTAYYDYKSDTNLLEKLTMPGGAQYHYEYTAQGELSKETNPEGHITEYSNHTGLGLPQLITGPYISGSSGVNTTLAYFDDGRLKTTTTVGATTSFTYTASGKLATLTRADGVVTSYVYDDAGRLHKVVLADGDYLELVPDTVGNIKYRRIFEGGVKVFEESRDYDELNRLLAVIASDGTAVTSYGYYGESQPASVTSRYDGSNTHTQTVKYDALMQLSKTELADGTVLSHYSYDGLGQLDQVTDANGNVTDYDYSGLGLLEQLTSEDTGVTDYDYDAAGNLVSKTDANNLTTSYSYDNIKRLTGVNHANSNLNIKFGYDDTLGGNSGVGRMTFMSDSSGSTQYFYNPRGFNTVKEVVLKGLTASRYYRWGYDYDLGGKLTSITYPNGAGVTYNYNPTTGELSDVTFAALAGDTPQTIATGFTFKPFGGLVEYNAGNSLIRLQSVTPDYQVDSISDSQGAVTVFDKDYQYSFNAGNVSAINDQLDSNQDQAFTYDPYSRLDTAGGNYGAIDYDYDLASNRTKKTVTETGVTTETEYIYEQNSSANNTGRLDKTTTTVDSQTPTEIQYSADNAGNMTSGSAAMSYNDAGRSSSGAKNETRLYLYNGLGQRVIKKFFTHYHFDAQGRLQAESDANTGRMQKLYIYGGGVLLALIDVSTTVDTDADGLDDDWELINFGDLTTANNTSDNDGDGISDQIEYENGLDPAYASTDDADGNGLLDDWERIYFGLTAVSANVDTDGDGLTNLQEYLAGLNPVVRDGALDQDQDALLDSWEYQYFGDLLQTPETDFDGDGSTNMEEYVLGCDPSVITPDCDLDGLTDSWEKLYYGDLSALAAADDDYDGSTNLEEMTLGCDPLVSTFDCDNDGLPDLWEQQYLGNIADLPTDDSDGDTITNLEEYSSGTDPSDKTSLPAYMWITPLLMVGS